ncbi:MAG: hypothetical protein PHR35_10445 [Kiritimatiellae bacterium]|nr:hypothetical protein [Kiritimatiellia bacterium]
MDDQPKQSLYGVDVASWRSLCEAADLFKRLAPWSWMSGDEIFGLRLPGSSQIAFISIVGREIKPPACHVLLGWEALSRFRLALMGRGSFFYISRATSSCLRT